jgi:hypothetical protein
MLCRGLPLQELHIASCKKMQIASDARLSGNFTIGFFGHGGNGLGIFRMDLRMGESGTLTWGLCWCVGVAANIHDGMTSTSMHTCTATWLHTPLLTAEYQHV